MFIICQSLPRGIVVKFNLNDFKNSAADVLRKFVVVILLVTSFLYLFSFIGKLHVFAMVYSKRIRLNLPTSVFYPISAFYPHFSVLSPFQRFIPVSVSAFSFRFRDSVSAFYPYPVRLPFFIHPVNKHDINGFLLDRFKWI
jgi:hypothetical protein